MANISLECTFILACILKKLLLIAQVRSLQIYKETDFTPYGQSLKDSSVFKCWEECLKTSCYEQKKREVENFNRYE